MERQGYRYDQIGRGYAQTRREDPTLGRSIERALGDAQSVANIGAGGGSYEPAALNVIAVEPSEMMVRQRDTSSAPVLRAIAQALPLADNSVDAAMTILSMHHWHPNQRLGVMEMRRVARDKIIIVTVDPVVSGQMWLMADYLPEVAELDHDIFPPPETVAAWIGVGARIQVVPIHRDTPDWTLMSFWAHPERVLDPIARNATSGFARQSPEVIERVVSEVARDLDSGVWDSRHGHLRTLDEFDAGLRLITG